MLWTIMSVIASILLIPTIAFFITLAKSDPVVYETNRQLTGSLLTAVKGKVGRHANGRYDYAP